MSSRRSDAEREAHAPLGPELIDQERMACALRVLEKQCGPPAFTVRSTISVISGRVDLGADAHELALALEDGDPSRGGLALASVTEPVRQLAERDHRDEDETDDEHREDDLLAFLRAVSART